MNVQQLRDILAALPGDMPVAIELTFDEGDGFEGADLRSAEVESRCDEVDRLYLWGAHDDDDAGMDSE